MSITWGVQSLGPKITVQVQRKRQGDLAADRETTLGSVVCKLSIDPQCHLPATISCLKGTLKQCPEFR